MHRWETLTALAAVIVASVSAFPVPGRLWYAGVAIVLLAAVGAAQIRRSLNGSGETKTGPTPEDIARRIREQRNRR